ncbi:hypothetical protein SeMB42_g02095 [Synchytrium endobioticum]|uniref:Uncharacterized protein n=1 Tax=Synchytrium endobioticum TaxID=286115 RepID=A0A507DJ21_9FUNG|nr:hypothetical protein SeLEV6574_g02581 [Synchytrium endobioticum]TPX50870.1 hypothetical protein SeMB42_g02095 [Synchytrium endobioticum]
MDVWIALTDSLRSRLQAKVNQRQRGAIQPQNGNAQSIINTEQVPWKWVLLKVIALLSEYPAGVTKAIIMSELETEWNDYRESRSRSIGGSMGSKGYHSLDVIGDHLDPFTHVEAKITDVVKVKGTQTVIVTLSSDTAESNRTVELYLHHKFIKLVDQGHLLNQRRIRITGLKLSPSFQNSRILLPTDLVVIILDSREDATFISSTFTNKLGHINPAQLNPGSFLLELLSISDTLSAQKKGRLKKVILKLKDDQGTTTTLMLYDDHMALSKLFKSGDLLGLSQPHIHYDLQRGMEYDPATVLFCIPMETKAEANLVASTPSQHPVKRNDGGELDYSGYPGRVRIQSIATYMSHFSLLGVVTMTTPLVYNSEQEGDMIGLRLLDETGMCDLTVWGTLAVQGLQLRPGQLIFVEEIETDANSPQDEIRMANAKHQLGSRVHVLSSIKGVMSTASLCRLSPLLELHRCPLGIYVVGVITDFAPRVVEFAFHAHTQCLKKLTKNNQGTYDCPTCHVPVLNPYRQGGEWVYDLKLDITDDTGSLVHANLHPRAARELLEMAPADFMELRQHERLSILADKISQEFIFSISAESLSNDQVQYCAEALVPIPSPVTELLNSLEHLSKRYGA